MLSRIQKRMRSRRQPAIEVQCDGVCDFEDTMNTYDENPYNEQNAYIINKITSVGDKVDHYDERHGRTSRRNLVRKPAQKKSDYVPVPTTATLCPTCHRSERYCACQRSRVLSDEVESDGDLSPVSEQVESPRSPDSKRKPGDSYQKLSENRFAGIRFVDESISSSDEGDDSPRMAQMRSSPVPRSSTTPRGPMRQINNVITKHKKFVRDQDAKTEDIFGHFHSPGEMASPQIDTIGQQNDLLLNLSPISNPDEFFNTLIRYIKSGNTSALNHLCRTVRIMKVDLSAPEFREKRYTASALHVALLFKRPQMAQELIFTCPELVKVEYTSSHLRGQTVFHIAAANNDIETFQIMLNTLKTDDEKRAAIDARATGDYFEKSHNEGAHCLTAALWAGQEQMLEFLLLSGAAMDNRGPNENTPLHHLVILSAAHPDKDAKMERMFKIFWKYCDSWWRVREAGFVEQNVSEQQTTRLKVAAMRYLLQIRNHDQQTPLSLAVNLQSPIAIFIINFEPVYRLPQTKFGTTAWVTYDVTDVTSYGSFESSWIHYNTSSVLHILAHRAKIVTDDKAFTDLIELQPIRDLVKMKWSVYRWVYYAWLICHLTYMIVLTWYVAYDAQSVIHYQNVHRNSTHNVSDPQIARSISEPVTNHHMYPWLFFILPFIYLMSELEDILFVSYSSLKSLAATGGRMKTLSFLAEQWTVTGNGPFRVTLVIFSVCIFCWANLHELQSPDRDIPLSLALVFGWIFMIFFTRGFLSISRFSIMVQKMFFQDFIYFLSVYMFVWLAFGSALQALIDHRPELINVSFGDTLYSMLNIITDAGEKATEQTSRLPKVASVLLSFYAIISVILLLNMLIAMMNSSYDAVKMSKTNLFRYQQLSIILLIERRLFWWQGLCNFSQKRVWSRRQTQHTDEMDGKRKSDLENQTDQTQTVVELRTMIPKQRSITKIEKLTMERLYLEITERAFAHDN